jgi:hypothetical protein
MTSAVASNTKFSGEMSILIGLAGTLSRSAIRRQFPHVQLP